MEKTGDPLIFAPSYKDISRDTVVSRDEYIHLDLPHPTYFTDETAELNAVSLTVNCIFKPHFDRSLC